MKKKKKSIIDNLVIVKKHSILIASTVNGKSQRGKQFSGIGFQFFVDWGGQSGFCAFCSSAPTYRFFDYQNSAIPGGDVQRCQGTLNLRVTIQPPPNPTVPG